MVSAPLSTLPPFIQQHLPTSPARLVSASELAAPNAVTAAACKALTAAPWGAGGAPGLSGADAGIAELWFRAQYGEVPVKVRM